MLKLKVSILILIALQLLLFWTSETVVAQRYQSQSGSFPNPEPMEPNCGRCSEYDSCEHILKDNNCRRAPCEFTPRCMSTAGISCAATYCENARCYRGITCERQTGCWLGVKCVPYN